MVTHKVTFCSNDEILYNALKRALKYIAGIDLTKYAGSFNKLNVVLYSMENNEFESWIWGSLRKRALSPVVVIGTEEKSLFVNKNPVFTDYAEEHAYFQIPFNLREFIDKIQNMKPIYDDVTRKLLVNEYSKGYEHKLVTHDLKIIGGDKPTSLDNLLQVREFYQSKGDGKTARIMDEKIRVIEIAKDWEQIAVDVRTYLTERLERQK